jgi:hypothetical protein
MAYLTLLVIIYLSPIVIPTVYSCSSTFKLPGTTTEDQTIEEGQPFLINCTLDKSKAEYDGREYTIDSSMLVMKHKNKRLVKGVNIINNSTIEYKVSRSSMKDSGYYFCFVDIAHFHSNSSNLKLICPTKIIIGSKYP